MKLLIRNQKKTISAYMYRAHSDITVSMEYTEASSLSLIYLSITTNDIKTKE